MIEQKQPKTAVVQDNALVNTAYSMTLNEKRLLMLVISKIDPNHLPASDRNLTVWVTVEEWRRRFGATQHNLYSELHKTCRRLMRQPELEIPVPGCDLPALAQWVIFARPDPERRGIKVTLYGEVTLFLAGMVDCYTRYNLENAQRLSGFYAIRLYELLAQYRVIGRRRFDLAELRRVLNVGDQYPRFSNFRQKVIDKSIADINGNTDLTVVWSPVKTGNRVTALDFHFKAATPDP